MTSVNLTETRRVLMAALERLDDLDGRTIPMRAPGKDRTTFLAGIQKDSLYLAHLLDLARVNTLSEYHRVRGGYTDHLPTEEQSR